MFLSVLVFVLLLHAQQLVTHVFKEATTTGLKAQVVEIYASVFGDTPVCHNRNCLRPSPPRLPW